METKDARHVISLTNYEWTGCEYCRERMSEDFAPRVNHYLEAHGCTLLHMGPITTHDDEGKPWHGVAAVLGSDVIPPPRKAPTFKMEKGEDGSATFRIEIED
jgi:hypothetical protein